MLLPDYAEIADKTVIIGLLSSAGYTLREASGCDTSTQLTPEMIQTLKEKYQIMMQALIFRKK